MDNQHTGRLIRELRTERGMTQRELAQQLHVTDRAVSKWERGVHLCSSLSTGYRDRTDPTARLRISLYQIFFRSAPFFCGGPAPARKYRLSERAGTGT